MVDLTSDTNMSGVAGAEVGAATKDMFEKGTQTDLQLYVRDPMWRYSHCKLPVENSDDHLFCRLPGKEIQYAFVKTSLNPKVLVAEILMEGFVPHSKYSPVEDSDGQYSWYTHYLFSNVQLKLLTKQNECIIWFYRNWTQWNEDHPSSLEYDVFPGNKRKHEQVADSDSYTYYDSTTESETDHEDMLASASANDTVAAAPCTPDDSEWFSPTEELPGYE